MMEHGHSSRPRDAHGTMHRQRPTFRVDPTASLRPPQTSPRPHHLLHAPKHLRPPHLVDSYRLASIDKYVFLFCIFLVFLDSRFLSCSPAPVSHVNLNPTRPSSKVYQSDPLLLSYDSLNFTIDGRPVRLVSGSVHYFRIPPSQWLPTLHFARHMGLNAIETYVPWNLHEPQKGVFRFSGILDLARFLSLAQKLELYVILRPGPYICSEWDFGGLPPYLLADLDLKVRSSDPAYIDAVSNYIANLAPIIEPFIGRPVVALQIENEYGQYAVDPSYMTILLSLWKTHGINRRRVMLFTSDNGNFETISNGSPFKSSEVLKTINFGGHVDEKISTLRSIQPFAPSMVMEFWVGWFDHWGSQHHTRSAEHVASNLRRILFTHDASVNFYMFMGGTNFGFMAGANFGTHGYQPDTTSYDYDALIAEHGVIRKPKFQAIRSILHEFWTQNDDYNRIALMEQVQPPPSLISAYSGAVPFTSSIPLLSVLDEVSSVQNHTLYPQTMEQVGGDFGYVLYRHRFSNPLEKDYTLQIHGVRDFALVMFDNVVAARIDRNHENNTTLTNQTKRINVPPATRCIEILVENSGRINYGHAMHDRKGIVGNVTLNDVILQSFDMFVLSFPQDHPWLRDVDMRTSIVDIIAAMHGKFNHGQVGLSSSPPALFHTTLHIDPRLFKGLRNTELPGTFCRIFGRGVFWVNGFNVGRFNTGSEGPQSKLFVPGSLLREGRNDVMVLHFDMQLAKQPMQVEFLDSPDYDFL